MTTTRDDSGGIVSVKSAGLTYLVSVSQEKHLEAANALRCAADWLVPDQHQDAIQLIFDDLAHSGQVAAEIRVLNDGRPVTTLAVELSR